MAHFAQIDENNRITQVVVINNSDCGDLEFPASEDIGVAFCKSLFGENTKWKQTSYNSKFRKHYAGIGSVYIEELDVFSIPQPFASWSLDMATGEWNAPIPMPEVPLTHIAIWDEDGQEWDIVLNKGAV